MFSVLAAMASLATIGLLFAMDPGGVIAESGFPNFRDMDWTQLVAWAFRTIGVVVAQLLIIVLWLRAKFMGQEGTEARRRPLYRAAPPTGSLPAAAVSVLQGHVFWSHTLLASIIEMCQRGTLRLECVGRRGGFLYRLSRQGPTHYDWEQRICDSLPSRPTTIDELDEALNKHKDSIGDQIGDFLQHRGLFHDNPVRARRESSGSGAGWTLLVGALTGVGGGLWMALWFSPWWANTLIGALIGFIYFLIAPLAPHVARTTPRGVHETERWLGWKASMAGPAQPDAQDATDSMLAYAVALDVAHPWLKLSLPAPPWFQASFLQGADKDAAFHGFLHHPVWGLAGQSQNAATLAVQTGEKTEVDRELQAQDSLPAATPGPASMEHQPHRLERAVEEEKGIGYLPRCCICLVSLVGIGVVVLVILFSLDVISPRDKPCPLDSPPIPTPAQIAVAGDLFRDGCVRVRGTIVFQDAGELVVEMDRGEYVQRVNVRDPSDALQVIPLGRVVALAGWLKVEEDGTYAVHFVPDRGSDREWWRNLLENLEGLF